MTESFAQWVVEERFVAGRPAWERVGVEMVDSVHPFEEAKIRILNASHSCIAWAGALRGLTYIHESVADPAIRRFAHDFVTHEVIPCLSPSPIDLARYRDTVVARFGNPHIQDTVARVAADGFAKLPGFIAPTLADRLRQGQSIRHTALAAALFLEFLQWHARGDIGFTYQDQAVEVAVLADILQAPDTVARFAAQPMLWGVSAGHPLLVTELREAQARLRCWLTETSRCA